jgi:hypothetical protein
VRSMTVYSELLRMALEADEDSPGCSVDELVALVVARRQSLCAKREGLDTPHGGVPLVNSLAYDMALVQLCQRLGVDQGLTDNAAGPTERRTAEQRLADRIPELAGVL